MEPCGCSPESLQKGQIRWHALGFRGASVQDKASDLFNTLCNCMEEARLANPWFACHHCDMEATGSRLLKLAPEGV